MLEVDLQTERPGSEELTNTARIYSMIDLFAGCGGLSLGFENAAFTPVFVNELNEHAMGTYLKNRHHSLGGVRFSENTALHCNDAHDLQGSRLNQLKSDLASIPELGLSLQPNIGSSRGGGSDLDVITGGPPCQGYSGIGIRRSYAVDKQDLPSNQLYQRMIAIIGELRPRLFLFENVRGLLNAKWTREGGRPIWPDVKSAFRSIPGYTIRWSLVFARDYGVAQNRPRVLLVGVRNDILEKVDFLDASADAEDAVACGFLPVGEPGSFPDLEDLLGDLVDANIQKALLNGNYPKGSFKTNDYPFNPMTDLQDALRLRPRWYTEANVRLTDHEYSKHAPNIVQKFIYMQKHGGEIPEQFQTKKFSQRLLPARWGNSTPNITATSMPDDYVHYAQPRVLTVREWARLQFFPDWYEFAGKRTTGGIRRAGNPQQGIFDREVPKYTQIGNAVPVALAERVGTHFRGILDSALK